MVIIAAVIFNVCTFHKLKKTNFEEKYYWELKLQNQFLIALFSVVVAVYAFVGWNSYKELAIDIKEKINKQIDEIVDTRFRNSVNKLNKDIEKVSQENKKNEDSLNNTSKQTNILKSDIERMYEQVNQRIYIIKKVKISGDGKIYFKNIKTIQGNFLPEFKEAPVVFLSKKNPTIISSVEIAEVTKEYIQLSNYDEGSDMFDILIVEK